MDEPFERDVMEDLIDETPRASADEAFDEPASMEAEGVAGEDAFADEMQDFEAGAMDELLAEDGFEEGFEADVGDEFAADYGEADPLQAMEEAIADALEADDSDEFLQRVSRGLRNAANMARQVGRGVGQAAHVVSPLASQVANIARRLLAEGADEFAALDEMLAFAEDAPAVDATAPVIAGLTIRTIMPRAARLPRTTRRELVRSLSQATRTLARRRGPQAARAVPRVVQAVQRTARRRRMPAQRLPRAVRRTIARVARDANLVLRLARAQPRTTSPACQCHARSGTRMPQRLVIRGPVEITIRSR